MSNKKRDDREMAMELDPKRRNGAEGDVLKWAEERLAKAIPFDKWLTEAQYQEMVEKYIRERFQRSLG